MMLLLGNSSLSDKYAAPDGVPMVRRMEGVDLFYFNILD